MSDEFLLDLRRDATSLVRVKQNQDVVDVRLEELASEDDVIFLSDRVEDNRWTGLFRIEENAEKLYEVSYNYETSKFYMTVYVMVSCDPLDPPHLY